jgi:hypothetical protein
MDLNLAGLNSVTSGATPKGAPTPSPTLSSPTPSVTAFLGGDGDSSGGGGNGSSHTGAIVGGVVGGVAVLAIAGVAILWILMRNKRSAEHHSTTAPPYTSPQTSHQFPTPVYPPSQFDKPPMTPIKYGYQRMSELPEYVPPTPRSGYGNSWAAGGSVPNSPAPKYLGGGFVGRGSYLDEAIGAFGLRPDLAIARDCLPWQVASNSEHTR